MTHWASPIGKTVLYQLSDLYRALVWEGFILLAVAAGENNATATQAEPGQEEATPTAAVAMEVDSPSKPPPEALVVVVVDPPTDQKPTARTAGSSEVAPPDPNSKPDSEHLAQQHPSILVESLKQLTPLLTITSRVGRSLAELMSLLIRLSTSPLHRSHRRGVGHPLLMHSYQEPAREAIEVCMDVTNLLVDSLKWEVPMPQACSSAMQSPIRDWLFAGWVRGWAPIRSMAY